MIWLLFISGVMLISYNLFSFYVGYRSAYWPSTSGRVLHSSVKVKINTTTSSKRRHYHPHVVYQYEVNNKKYTSNKIVNYLGFGNDVIYAKELINNYPENSAVKVYYCPFYKGVSILSPGMKQQLMQIILLFTGTVVVLGSSPVLFSENPYWFIEKVFA
jgi:hypothetical protein